jgi:hypothetical protein
LSEDSVVGPRANGFSSGKDSEAGDIVCIVDGAGRRPDEKQAARSQIESSDKACQSIIASKTTEGAVLIQFFVLFFCGC